MIRKYKCDWCGKEFERHDYFAKGKKHLFCSRQCLADFSNKTKNPTGYSSLKDYSNMSIHCTDLNRRLNPTRMTDDVRGKLREARLGYGEGVTYTKYFGKHEHRVVAEKILGRPLLQGEVIHHRDGNKRNNAPENLVIFSSQSEHAKHHAELRWFLQEIKKLEGGDAL